MTLSPVYRVALNKNLLVDLGFIDFLKQQFRNVLYSTIGQRHVDTEQVYRFTIYEIPPQWDSFVLSTILMAQAGLMEMTLKQEKISQILLDLNPLDPKRLILNFGFLKLLIGLLINVGTIQSFYLVWVLFTILGLISLLGLMIILFRQVR